MALIVVFLCAGCAGATVRCATRVTARIITHEQLVEYLLQQPMAKHQVSGRWRYATRGFLAKLMHP
jgi:hypothetical protein